MIDVREGRPFFGLGSPRPLLRATGRVSEAAKMEARAKAIRAKHAQKNPVE